MNWQDIPSLAALRAFEAAARHKSLSAAARDLNVTHAAIAQHVRQLEADLGVTLLERAGRGMAPTDAGQNLARDLQDGFATIGAAIRHLRNTSQVRPVHVSVTPSFATHWLMPRIGQFWQAQPDVALNINPSVGLVDLRRDGFDMAIRFGDGQWPDTDSRLLTHGDFWIVAAPAFLQKHPASTLLDTQHMPWVMEPHMLELRRLVEDQGLDLSHVELTLLESNALVLSAAVAGLGVSVHPKSLVERDVAAGTLQRIAQVPSGVLGYYIVTPCTPLRPQARLFQKWLFSEAQPPPQTDR